MMQRTFFGLVAAEGGTQEAGEWKRSSACIVVVLRAEEYLEAEIADVSCNSWRTQQMSNLPVTAHRRTLNHLITSVRPGGPGAVAGP